MAASIVFLVLLKVFEGSIATNINHLEWVWRLLLGIGIIPAVFTLYARLTIAETLPYKQCKMCFSHQASRVTDRERCM